MPGSKGLIVKAVAGVFEIFCEGSVYGSLCGGQIPEYESDADGRG